jgi:hypothetical protein
MLAQLWIGVEARCQSPQSATPQILQPQAEQLFALANQTRAEHGLGLLKWDTSLAQGALAHCERMASEGPIAHRYGGEPDLTARAAHAGAHFSLIEENIAVGPYAASIHQGWMNSPDHRANLLNPAIDHVGIAVVADHGVLFAVADYSRAVPMLTPAQVDANFAEMLHARGLKIINNAAGLQAYCQSSGRFSGSNPPSFLMRWQNPDVSQLPADLVKRLNSEGYRAAAVASCPAQDVDAGFTLYRVAVFLYDSGSEALIKPFYQP